MAALTSVLILGIEDHTTTKRPNWPLKSSTMSEVAIFQALIQCSSPTLGVVSVKVASSSRKMGSLVVGLQKT